MATRRRDPAQENLDEDVEPHQEPLREDHDSGEQPEMLAEIAEGLVQQLPQP